MAAGFWKVWGIKVDMVLEFREGRSGNGPSDFESHKGALLSDFGGLVGGRGEKRKRGENVSFRGSRVCGGKWVYCTMTKEKVDFLPRAAIVDLFFSLSFLSWTLCFSSRWVF